MPSEMTECECTHPREYHQSFDNYVCACRICMCSSYKPKVTIITDTAIRTRCSCSFPHPPHDFCDGNPDAPMFPKALTDTAIRTRCSCSFPHPPHDFCDGNPDAPMFPKALTDTAIRTRCSCSFPHPPHDFCDGNPDAPMFPKALTDAASPDALTEWELERAGLKMQIDAFNIMLRHTCEERDRLAAELAAVKAENAELRKASLLSNTTRLQIDKQRCDELKTDIAISKHDHDLTRIALAKAEADLAAANSALGKINEIRNGIVGLQTTNWSEHVYPLVAILNSAGFKGMEYSEALANYGTSVERAVKAEAVLDRIMELVPEENRVPGNVVESLAIGIGKCAADLTQAKADLAAMKAEVSAADYLRANQLAAISTALMSDTPITHLEARIPKDHACYTPAFDDAMRTIDKVLELRADLAEAVRLVHKCRDNCSCMDDSMTPCANCVRIENYLSRKPRMEKR